jgi:hypothetical protein
MEQEEEEGRELGCRLMALLTDSFSSFDCSCSPLSLSLSANNNNNQE